MPKDLARVALGAVAVVFLLSSTACLSETRAGELPELAMPRLVISKMDGAEMIHVPGGEFTMGAEDLHFDQQPMHQRYVASFYVDKYEVTNAQYKLFVDATGHRVPYLDQPYAQAYNWVDGTYPEGQDEYPVVLVSWHDAKAYAEWAGKRLPTEAEWEKAVRGTDGRLYPWGNDPDPSRNNSWEGGLGRTAPVGSYPQGASFYGLMDMGGNVWEWVEDWHERYPGNEDPSELFDQKYRVARGSSWGNVMKYVRTSNRHFLEPDHLSTLIGFRTASTVPPD